MTQTRRNRSNSKDVGCIRLGVWLADSMFSMYDGKFLFKSSIRQRMPSVRHKSIKNQLLWMAKAECLFCLNWKMNASLLDLTEEDMFPVEYRYSDFGSSSKSMHKYNHHFPC